MKNHTRDGGVERLGMVLVSENLFSIRLINDNLQPKHPTNGSPDSDFLLILSAHFLFFIFRQIQN